MLDGGKCDWKCTMSVVKQVNNNWSEKLFISTKIIWLSGEGGVVRYEVLSARLCVNEASKHTANHLRKEHSDMERGL